MAAPNGTATERKEPLGDKLAKLDGVLCPPTGMPPHRGPRLGECVMAETNWSRRFDDPIELPDGRIVNTIGEAAEYALELPSEIGSTPAMAARG